MRSWFMKSMWSESVTASFILELWHFNQCITGKHSSPLFCGCNRALAVYHCGATVWLLPASHNDTSCSIQRWHFRNWAYKRNYLMWPQYIIAPPRQLAPCTSPTSFISPMTSLRQSSVISLSIRCYSLAMAFRLSRICLTGCLKAILRCSQ